MNNQTIYSQRVPRDSRFERLRIVAMLAVVLCHAIAYLPWGLESAAGWKGSLAIAADQYLGQFGVTIFFLLSGYFLVQKPFDINRIVKIVVQTFCYSAVCLIIAICVVPNIHAFKHADMPWGGVTLVRYLYIGLFPIVNNAYWFITAYVLMIVFSPIVNVLFRLLTAKQAMWFIGVVGGFSILPYISFTGFAYNGLFWTTIVYAIFGYAIGGWIRLYGQSIHVHVSWLLIAIYTVFSFGVLLAFIEAARLQIGIAQFFAWAPRSIYGTLPLLPLLLSACIIFRISISTKNPLKIDNRFGAIVTNTIASSVFGIYLIHQNIIIGNDLWKIVGMIVPAPDGIFRKAVVCLLIGIGVFMLLSLCSFVFDRLVVRPLQSVILSYIKKTSLNGFVMSLNRSLGL